MSTHPDDAATVSTAVAGEIAEKPDDVFELEVENNNDETVGFVQKWSGAEWIYAETEATRWLQEKRCDEFSDSKQ